MPARFSLAGGPTSECEKIVVILAVPILAFAVLWIFDPIPPSGRDTWHYQCAICGLWRSHGVKYVLGMRTRRFEQPPHRGEQAELYDKLIGVPHEHEWVYEFCGTERRRIRSTRIGHGDAFPFRIRLMRYALRAINDEFKDRPADFRQELYFRLIGCASWEEFYDVLEEERSRPQGEKGATDL